MLEFLFGVLFYSFIAFLVLKTLYAYYRYFVYGEELPKLEPYNANEVGSSAGNDLINNPAFDYLPQNVFHDHFSNDYHSTSSSTDDFLD